MYEYYGSEDFEEQFDMTMDLMSSDFGKTVMHVAAPCFYEDDTVTCCDPYNPYEDLCPGGSRKNLRADFSSIESHMEIRTDSMFFGKSCHFILGRACPFCKYDRCECPIVEEVLTELMMQKPSPFDAWVLYADFWGYYPQWDGPTESG